MSVDKKKIYDSVKPTPVTPNRRFGKVKDVRIMYHNDTGRSRRFGFVTFEEPETLEAVINFPGGHDVDGKKVSRCLA